METFSALLAICAGNSPVPVNSPHKGQWRGALMFSLIYPGINGWVNNREAGDLRRYPAHYDVTLMITKQWLALCALLCSYDYRIVNDMAMQACEPSAVMLLTSHSQNFPLSPPKRSIFTHHSVDFNTVNIAWNFRAVTQSFHVIIAIEDGISERSTGRWRVNSIGIPFVGIRRSNVHLIITSATDKLISYY